MSNSDSNNNSNTDQDEQSRTGKKIRQIMDYFFNFCFFFFPGAVSKVHQQEATEKYWILRRDVEMLYSAKMDKLRIKDEPGYLPPAPKDVDDFVETKIKLIEKGPENIVNELKKILYFYKILIKDKAKLTRREGQLNMLWRDMTFIRTRMLTDKIIPDEKLPFYLDFCIGEAARLGIQDNEEIKGLIHEAAVELNDTDSSRDAPPSNNRSTRNIVRILTRLNDRRLQRLHEQRMNKLIYQSAFLILLTLSFLLLYNHDHVLAPKVNKATCTQKIQVTNNETKVAKTDSPGNNQKSITEKADLPAPINSKTETGDIESSKQRLWEKLPTFPVKNPLFFIFFAGLIGGFLSTVMRLGQGSKDLKPGDDAYYAWYVLTKPVVGALGAAILYIIVRADFVPLSVFSAEYIVDIKCLPVSAKGFAFGCIMGFSERVIMPKVK